MNNYYWKMKKKDSLFYHILVFILAQISWLTLLGMWIYWYVSNNIFYAEVGDRISPQISIDTPNVLIFVLGVILIVAIGAVISLIFRNLNVQLKLTRLYDNFIANVTHELKSPLASIQLYLETMNSRKVSAEDQKRFLELMLKDTTRLHKLINSILEIPRIEQKKVAHTFHVYSADKIINKLLNDSIEQFMLPKSSISIERKIDCECVIDPNALKIVFNNLIDNAIKYSVNPIRINVVLKTDAKKLYIFFTDNGIGLAPKDQKKVFKKFQRINRKDIPSVKGTGLGLYWVREIIKSHGGDIKVESPGVNRGTKFTIELPKYRASKKAFVNYLLKSTLKREEMEELNEQE